MMYQFYDLAHAALMPARAAAKATRLILGSQNTPWSHTPFIRSLTASAELFERTTRRFGQPEFNLPFTRIDGHNVAVSEVPILEKPFCTLTHFKRACRRNDPKILVIAPLSGHFSTLLRGTVEALLPHHDVYITEWVDARLVPQQEGRFDLDDYIDYCMTFMRQLGPDTHVMAVCQPAVPAFAAIALLAGQNDPNQPLSMTLMGGPIDPRIAKTTVTELAEQRPLSWFENTVTANVPAWYPGAGRRVYPGFVQLSGFMSMNLDRHVGSHVQFFQHLVEGDGDSADAHRRFYNEYLAVMDLPAEFYLQTVKYIFQRHALPKGELHWRDPQTDTLHHINPAVIKKTALLTIEGELDDISARGQTMAAHALTPGISAAQKYHYCQPNVGHYGIFNGSRWRTDIMPRFRHFVRKQGKGYTAISEKDLMTNPDKRPDVYKD